MLEARVVLPARDVKFRALKMSGLASRLQSKAVVSARITGPGVW